MPTARRSRTIAAPEQELWEVIRDPHHLPRWWPRVTRVEDVQDGEFTEVMKTSKGRLVRADFRLLEDDRETRAVRWEQRVPGTPFARLLKSAETEVRLEPARPGEPALASSRGHADQSLRAQEDPESSAIERSPVAATTVTIELRQTLNGFFPRFGGYMVRRAAGETLEQALDGLERISG
jgi:uncharacterized protein YndB with AHSA1/START domain